LRCAETLIILAFAVARSPPFSHRIDFFGNKDSDPNSTGKSMQKTNNENPKNLIPEKV
jgi:hypothetical protein